MMSEVDTGGGSYFRGNVHAQGDIIGTKYEINADVARVVAGLPNPYLGLHAFSFDDRASFTGRADETREAVRMLTHPTGSRPLLFITGASGCGKSSFAQAGVLPALVAHYAQRNFTVASPVSFRPSTHPIAMLADALVQLGLPKRVTADPLGAIGTAAGFAAFVGEQTADDQVNLVLIDQFEEVFTQARPDERDAIIGILSELPAFDALRTHLVVTLRSDFLGDLFPYRGLYEVAKDGIDLREMNETELRGSIERPLQAKAEHSAAYRGKSWEPGLVRELAVQAAVDAAYLPLLQVTLQELWRSGELTLASYRDIGNTLASAIRNRATNVVRFTDHHRSRPVSPRPEPDQRLILRLLLDPVQVSAGMAGHPDSRGRRSRAELVGDLPHREELLEDLVAARLLSVQRKDEVEYVDIIHESLIANWEWLQNAIAAERLALQRRARFEQARDEWLLQRRTDEYLLVGVRLAEARELAESGDVAVRSPEARDLLARSIARKTAEDQRALLEEQQRREHQRALQLSESLRLASEAREITDQGPDVALLIA